ncbi:uncharacterized protein [Diadema antillarum]|uniref:uncharacterized protein n=1 Tax=Diadema antillarum TaxID=105358 RepID=UPI003A84D9B9
MPGPRSPLGPIGRESRMLALSFIYKKPWCKFFGSSDAEPTIIEGGQTSLMCASQIGNRELVQELLQKGADVKAMDEDKWTPLIFAAREGHLEIAKALLDKGADVDHADVNDWTPLMWASYKGHTDIVKELLDRKANPNVQAHHGVTPIIWAAGRGHSGVVAALLKAGAKVNSADKYGTSGLVWAARKGHVDCVMLLLEHGANVDMAGMNSWTALLVASRGGYVDVVQMLLDKHPNVNAVDKDGMSSLCCAAMEGHAEVAELLLNSRAYVNIQDKHEDSVLIHAVKGGHPEVVKLLLKKCADVDIQGEEKKTALYWAAEKDHLDILETILECNPNTELATKDGETPLLRATRNRSREVVRALLDKGAKVSATDKRGDTPLHIAIRYRDKKISELLLRNPKDGRLLYKPNKEGETPYNIDCNHQKGILTQIFGARSFSPSDEVENELSDLCSSSLADILSEPTLLPPVTVGLYARWGSGKSFILKKLQDEMFQFARQDFRPMFRFTCWVFILCALVGLAIGAVVLFIPFAMEGYTFKGAVSLAGGVALGVFLLLYFLLALVYFGHRQKWRGSGKLSKWLARQFNYFRLVMALCYCNPPVSSERTAKVLPVRFIFGDHLHLSNLGSHAPLARTIGSLGVSLEKELGTLVSRLYRVVRSTPDGGKSRFKRYCCIPRFIITMLVIGCLLSGLVLLVKVEMHMEIVEAGEAEKSAITKHKIAMLVLLGIVALSLILNLWNFMQFVYQMVYPPRVRMERKARQAGHTKPDDFLRSLKQEVTTLTNMVQCMDAFQGVQTRLVVIVDGLDSCEQEQILSILDSIKALFSSPNSPNSPYITILAIDPYIITKAIDQNLHNVFKESNVRGHDYLRNLVHLPFYLEVGIRLKDSAEMPLANHVSPSTSRTEMTIVTTVPGDQPPKYGSPDAMNAPLLQRQRSTTKDLSQMLASDEQFSDLSPRSMRRLLNIVSITGRLLRANNIPFKWQTLAHWINLTERWPYRTSRLIVYYQENEEHIEDDVTLKLLCDRIAEDLQSLHELDTLAEMDQDHRSFMVCLARHAPQLAAGDIRNFLSCTCNLDPQLRKQIRDSMDNADSAGVLPNIGSIARPQSLGHAFPTISSRASVYSSISDTPSRLNYQMMASNPFMKKILQSPGNAPSPGILTVKDVCDRLLSLDGIDKHSIPRYQTRIAEHNINGPVLLQCDLDELKIVLDMTFGDWQLFKAMVLQMRGQALSAAATPHSPSQASSDPLQMEGEEEETAKTEEEPVDPANDYLNLSYEELRKNSQMSSQRSSIHNSHMSLGTMRSESSHVDTSSGENTPARKRAGSHKHSTSTSLAGMLVSMDSGTEQSNKPTQDGTPQAIPGAVPPGVVAAANTRIVPVTTMAKSTASVGTSTGQTTVAAVHPGNGKKPSDGGREKEGSVSSSSESNTDITALRRDSRGDISEDEPTPTPEDPKPDSRTKQHLFTGAGDKAKRKLQRQVEEDTESSPLLGSKDEADGKESKECKAKSKVKEKLSNGSVSEMEAMLTESSESPLHLSSLVSAEETSSSEQGSRPQPEQEDRYQISPTLKEQVTRDVNRMFDNIQTEITSRGKEGQPSVITSPTLGRVRAVRTPIKGEQETHGLSLLASYSTFIPPVRELDSVPESHVASSQSVSSVGRARRPGVTGGSPIKHSQSVGALPAPSSIGNTDSFSRFSDTGAGLHDTKRTLDQSFDEFIKLSLGEQRKRRHQIHTQLSFENERKPSSGQQRMNPNVLLRRSAPVLNPISRSPEHSIDIDDDKESTKVEEGHSVV